METPSQSPTDCRVGDPGCTGSKDINVMADARHQVLYPEHRFIWDLLDDFLVGLHQIT